MNHLAAALSELPLLEKTLADTYWLDDCASLQNAPTPVLTGGLAAAIEAVSSGDQFRDNTGLIVE